MGFSYTIERCDRTLLIKLCGEIDHHGAQKARGELDALICSAEQGEVCLDLSRITFCDSSGLGLVMGRMKKSIERGKEFSVCNPSSTVEKILNLAGIDRLVKIKKS